MEGVGVVVVVVVVVEEVFGRSLGQSERSLLFHHVEIWLMMKLWKGSIGLRRCGDKDM